MTWKEGKSSDSCSRSGRSILDWIFVAVSEAEVEGKRNEENECLWMTQKVGLDRSLLPLRFFCLSPVANFFSNRRRTSPTKDITVLFLTCLNVRKDWLEFVTVNTLDKGTSLRRKRIKSSLKWKWWKSFNTRREKFVQSWDLMRWWKKRQNSYKEKKTVHHSIIIRSPQNEIKFVVQIHGYDTDHEWIEYLQIFRKVQFHQVVPACLFHPLLTHFVTSFHPNLRQSDGWSILPSLSHAIIFWSG